MNDVDKAINKAKDKVAQTSNYVQDKATELGKKTLDKALDAGEYFVQLVKDNPYKSVGLAFLSGYIISICRNKLKGK